MTEEIFNSGVVNHKKKRRKDSILKSIEDYDPDFPVKITESASVKAMKNLCILRSELKLPKKDQLKDLGDKELENIVLDHHRNRINKLINRIKVERLRILRDSSNPDAEKKAVNINDIDGHKYKNTVDLDKILIEKIRKRQQREVEQMIQSVVALETMQKDAEDRVYQEELRRINDEKERRLKREQNHERHLRRIQELEEEERRKLKEDIELRRKQYEREQENLRNQQKIHEEKIRHMKELEQRRQERAEQNRQYIEKIEQDKRNRILKQQKKIEERELKRIETLRIEQKRQQEEREENAKKRQMHIEAIHNRERMILEAKKEELEKKDREYEEQRILFEQRRREEQRAFTKMQQEKIKRYTESRIRIDEIEMQRKLKSVTSDEEIEKRIKSMLQLRLKRAEDARLGRSDMELRNQKRQKEWDEKIRKKDNEMRKSQIEKDKHIQEVMKIKEKERKKLAILRKLKEDEKIEAAQRLERQRQRRVLALKEKLERNQEYANMIESQKLEIKKHREEMIIQLQKERDLMNQTFSSIRINGKTDIGAIRKLAAQYGLDLDQIVHKVKSRYRTRNPISVETPRKSLLFVPLRGPEQ